MTRLNDAWREVLARPEDDAPRLEFAAACEVEGDVVRAKFIRDEIASQHALLNDDFAGWSHGAGTRYSLLAQDGDTWAGPIVHRVVWYNFLRGFVERVGLSTTTFLRDAEELYTLAPILRLSLTDVASLADSLFASPHLGRIVSLSLERAGLGDRGVEALARSPNLRALRSLDLTDNAITADGLEQLVASPNLPALKRVELRKNPCAPLGENYGEDWDGTFIFVAESPLITSLEAKYGKKAWLHSVGNFGRRALYEGGV